MDRARIVPSFDELVNRFTEKLRRRNSVISQSDANFQARIDAGIRRIEGVADSHNQNNSIFAKLGITNTVSMIALVSRFMLFKVAGIKLEFHPSDPDEFNPNERDMRNFKRFIIEQYLLQARLLWLQYLLLNCCFRHPYCPCSLDLVYTLGLCGLEASI